MKLFFSPEYSGTVYVKPTGYAETSSTSGTGVMMDTVVVNTIGLINLLELRLGLHYSEIPAQERLAHYYKAVCLYMKDNPDNVMADSFKVSGLSTAKSMLSWRDELRNALWDFEGKEISGRLAVLIGVEEIFRKTGGVDIAGRLHVVCDQVRIQNLCCEDLVIIMPVNKEFLKPAIKELIDALQLQGATIEQAEIDTGTNSNLDKVRKMIASQENEKITLDKDDDSFQIWKFADNRLACEYLSYYNMEDVDVWVNTDNKQMDNWLMLMNKSLTGSVTANCTPRLTQMFVMGLSMFSNPLNVNTLVEWLNMPLHPLNKFFRSVLADTIATEGGYRNEACRKIIKDFIEGKFVYLTDEQKTLSEEEQKEIRLKRKKEREKNVDVFLPAMSSTQDIKKETVCVFVSELSSWARQQSHLMADNGDNEQWAEQLMAVSGMCEVFNILLGTISEDTVDYNTIDSWVRAIYEKGTYTNAVAECGSRNVVDSPAKIVSVAKKTVWIGVDGDASIGQECAFLYPTERKSLIEIKEMTPWEESSQNSYYEQQMMIPLRMTSGQLILVVRERENGEPTLKHPFIVRLEQQIENFNDIVKYPAIEATEKCDAQPVNHDVTGSELVFNHADEIKWEDHLSPTSIGTLAEYPFDYLMERLLDITNDAKAQMSDIRTTKGNVAHAVIEKLFSPREGEIFATPEVIDVRIKNEYEKVYAEVLEAKGAILQLAENELEEKLLNEQLRRCLDSLLGIIKANNLKVTGCEHYVECQMDLGLPKAIDANGNEKNRDMLGYIDMTLEDQNGSPVVFDFKWTTWAQGYKDKIKENRSIQLELYRMMLGREKKKGVAKVAYFLMPEGCLYSKEDFAETRFKKVECENAGDIVEQLKHSVEYRMEQIKSGKVETNGEFTELQYVQDTATKGLFPLKENNGKKKENFFSDYKIFNK